MSDFTDALAAMQQLTQTMGGSFDEWFALMVGTADGGPNGNGYYPITPPGAGDPVLRPSPARLAASASAARSFATYADAAEAFDAADPDWAAGETVHVYGPDAGTHTDPVTEEAGVANKGVYSVVTGVGLQRLSALDVEVMTTLLALAVAAKEAAEGARDDEGVQAVATDLLGANTIGTVAADLAGANVIGAIAAALSDPESPLHTAVIDAQKWAESEGEEPGGPGTKSAKEWAGEAQDAAEEIGERYDMTSDVDVLFAVKDAGDALPFRIDGEGVTHAIALRSDEAKIGEMESREIAFKTALGGEAGGLGAGATSGLVMGIRAGSALPLVMWPDGVMDAPALLDPASLFSGNALVTNEVVLEARRYARDRRHVWAHWRSTGESYRITADDSADHSIAGFDDTTGRALIQRRKGNAVRAYWVDATASGGAIGPLTSRRDVFMIGDSFSTDTLLTAIKAGMSDQKRSFVRSASGGAWLLAHLAALGGAADPIGGGVVQARHVGSSPTRDGGAAQCTVTGSIAGDLLTVTAASTTVTAGQEMIRTTGGLTVSTPPTILAHGTGGTSGVGGTGTYKLSAAPGDAASGTVYLGPWTYPGLPQHRDATLIVMDGGLDDAVDGQAAVIARIEAFADIVTPLFSSWYYVQSGLSRLSTPTQVTDKLALDAAIEAAIGWHYIPTYDYMRSHGTGSTTGANGGAVWAADNYFDNIHGSTAGQGHLGACIGSAVELKGN